MSSPPKFLKPTSNRKRKNSRTKYTQYIFILLLLTVSALILFCTIFKSSKASSNSTHSTNQKLGTCKDDTFYQTNPSNGNIDSFTLVLLDEELSLKYITESYSEKEILHIKYEQKDKENKLKSMVSLLSPINDKFTALITKYKRDIEFYTSFGEKYYYNPYSELGKKFPMHLFKLQRVGIITIEYFIKINELATQNVLDTFQEKILLFLVVEFILKEYFACKEILITQSELFLRRTFRVLKLDPIKYFKWLKGRVLYQKILNMTFENIHYTNESKNVLGNYLLSKGFGNEERFTIRNHIFIPYYILGESFFLVFYMFEIDEDGNVIETQQWVQSLIEDYKNKPCKEELGVKLKKMENLVKEMIMLWINESKQYDLKKIMDKYGEILKLSSRLDILLSNN
eukprot:GAHX01003043.1.p1 GENE.GAHX01003043.1~~GAHX01003043.1.p1  ORF type:complete len:399 (-),score=79.04 GAHX01003043.1:25-1221(-)